MPAGGDHRPRAREPARERRRVVVARPARGRVRRGRDHPVRPHRLPRPLRLRAEGLRSDELDRPQGLAPHGSLRADDPRGGAAGGVRLADRRLQRARARRRLDRDRNRRAALLPGVLRRPAPGRADVFFAGGTEAPITQVGIAGFDAMRALSRRNEDPQHASRPFDNERDGLVMGEAAAALVLEELGHAQARGATIYAELLGYGVSADASHMTEPDPTGENPARAMAMAIADAGVDPSEVGYINAHATSTPLGDASETRVIKRALGEENASRVAVSSTKGATGHCFGAAGAVEAVFSVMAVRERKLPPTINYEAEDPDCDLDYIPNESRDAPDLTVALSNSFGFGGHNASIVVRRWDE